jgi:PAS domain S-box-containing protein
MPLLKILVAEDYEPFRRFVCSALQQNIGFEISEASDGLDAVHKAEGLQPGLILLDIGLPKLNGLEAAQQIRRLTPSTKILFISQLRSEDVIRQALRLGAFGFVYKAHAQRDLLPAVETVLSGKRFVSGGLGVSEEDLRITEVQQTDEIRLRYAAIVESSDDAIIAESLEGLITAWNPAARNMFGYPQEEVIGQPITIIIPPELQEEETESLRRLRAGEHIEHYQTRRVSKNGRNIDISLTISPIKNAEGEIIGASTISRDITDSHRALAALRESEERFRLAAEAGKMYAFNWDALNNVIVRSGDPAQIVGGDGLMRASSQQVWAQVHPDDRERLKAAAAKLTPEDPRLRISHRMIRQDGEVIWVERNCRAHFDKQGRMLRILGMVADVTERRQTEKALAKSEELLRMAAQSGRMFAYEWDAATDKIVRSNGVTQVLGEDEGTFTTGQHILEMIPQEDRVRLSNALAELSPEKPLLHIRYRMLRSDGTLIWIDRNSRAYFDPDGKLQRIIGMIADITDRIRAEEMLRQKDRELSEAQRLAQVGSWRWDARDDTVTWSEELYRIGGLDPALPLPPFNELRRQFTVESRERLQRAVEAALRDRAPYELDLEIVRPNGATRWITARGEAVSDTAGNVVGLRGTSQDITERKLAEEALSKVSQKLIEAQEQERSRLARELHDDINQRLALLSVQLNSLKQGEARKQIEELASDIQALSHRLHSPKLDFLGLASAAAGFCRELSDRQGVDIAFRSENVPKDLPQGISLCLFRVLQEALQNAIKHSTSRQFQVSLKADAHEVELTVHDSGVGFEPSEAIKGPGLGLTSMRERLRLVDGELSIDSQLRRGTTIHALVPLDSKT